MKLVFLSSTKSDLVWFKHYYTNVFPQGKIKADNRFLAILKTLKSNPYIGHTSENSDGTREFPILKTPFTLIYRVRDDRIEILRIVDGRSNQE